LGWFWNKRLSLPGKTRLFRPDKVFKVLLITRTRKNGEYMAVEKKDKPEPAAAAPAKSSENNLIAALCYIPIMAIGFIVSLFVLLTEKKENKFLKFHAIQALFLMIIGGIAFFCLWIVLVILTMLVAAFTYGIGGICMMVVMLLVLVGYVVLFLFCAWKAYQGVEYELPVLGKFARKYV
jgi:uncharacterized membrane protein